jgi:Xaa-Pro aminopeptidase
MVLNNALLSIGFSLFFNIVLFDENAALPHGGFATGDKVLDYDTMVLIDVGAHYLGYSSDICRSFFIDKPKHSYLDRLMTYINPPNILEKEAAPRDSLHAEKLKVWAVVLEAQTAARKQMKPGNSAASVDLAARKVICMATSFAGHSYCDYFTHRVGHGIGIKAHESPYLNKGNTAVSLLPGMAFTDEPGIYVTGKFGVRHEDVYLVREDGEAENLSGGEARGPWEP